MIAVLLCALLCVVVQLTFQTRDAQIASADPLVTLPVGQHAAVENAAATSTVPAPAVSTGVTKAVQTCVPANDDSPTPLNLTDTTGLKQQIDTPDLYQIYGNNAAALRTQITRCAPKSDGSDAAEFVANTAYQMTWNYSYADDNGTCRVTQATVGIHILQTMPKWNPTSSAQAGFAAKWNSFVNNLTTHENGHAALDTQYAQQLLNDLNNFPPTPCGQLPQAVKLLTDTDVSELAQANDNYDSTTNHGATQGAILP